MHIRWGVKNGFLVALSYNAFLLPIKNVFYSAKSVESTNSIYKLLINQSGEGQPAPKLELDSTGIM